MKGAHLVKETAFIQRVIRRLPKAVHSQSMTGASMSQNGTPDRYFDGPTGDMWVEFKVLDRIPKSRIVRAAFSPLQLRWGLRAHANGRKILGMTGILFGRICRVAVQLPDEWEQGSVADLISVEDAADIITAHCATGEATNG